MGPRSENRGYRSPTRVGRHCVVGFNGSTVREPWLCGMRSLIASSTNKLQWVHGPRTVVIAAMTVSGGTVARGFNGSTVREPWLSGQCLHGLRKAGGFNGSTVREPWLCGRGIILIPPGGMLQWVHGPRTVVMSHFPDTKCRNMQLQWVHGPRTVVMYTAVNTSLCAERLQWVHGPRTVVIIRGRGWAGQPRALQWVHGPRTVVMRSLSLSRRVGSGASMGPRSENRGYAQSQATHCASHTGFNGSTVREPWLWNGVNGTGDAGWASMGPRSENRGYDISGAVKLPPESASMGPRSENRGYWSGRASFSRPSACFNGSTVREPWLCSATVIT